MATYGYDVDPRDGLNHRGADTSSRDADTREKNVGQDAHERRGGASRRERSGSAGALTATQIEELVQSSVDKALVGVAGDLAAYSKQSRALTADSNYSAACLVKIGIAVKKVQETLAAWEGKQSAAVKRVNDFAAAVMAERAAERAAATKHQQEWELKWEQSISSRLGAVELTALDASASAAAAAEGRVVAEIAAADVSAEAKQQIADVQKQLTEEQAGRVSAEASRDASAAKLETCLAQLSEQAYSEAQIAKVQATGACGYNRTCAHQIGR